MDNNKENTTPENNPLLALGRKLEEDIKKDGYVITSGVNTEDYQENSYLTLINREDIFDLNVSHDEVVVTKKRENTSRMYVINDDEIYEVNPNRGIHALSIEESEALINQLLKATPDKETMEEDYEAFKEDISRTEGRQFWARDLPFDIPFPPFLKQI